MTGTQQVPREQARARLDAATALLPRVTTEAPAAVLLVDIAAREVLFANPLAEQLVPGLSLPASIDAWAEAAGLLDLHGEPLTYGGSSTGAHPLSQVAEGLPVSGQAVSARRSSDVSAEREPLWVVGVPLYGAPLLDHCALVVLLPLRDTDAVAAAASAARTEQQVRERAVLATGLAFTVADAQAPDRPLVWVNPAFEATTGYTLQESVGRNCRFLQGPETDPEVVAEISRALDAGEAVTVTLLNYRKDGTAFWNQLAMSPVLDGEGTLTHFVGIQTDVTERRLAEVERERALVAERAAREEAERTRAHLTLLAEATGLLASTLDPAESLDRLARLVVPLLADWVVVNLVGEDGELSEVTVRHAEGHSELARRFHALQPQSLTPGSPIRQVLADGRPQLLHGLDGADMLDYTDSTELAEVIDRLGCRSSIVVPMQARRRTLGTLSLVSASRDYDEGDLLLAADLGRRAGLTVDNARLYQREHDAAVVLQRSLLPDLPRVPGLECAARYLAGDTAAQVGGDFYEVLSLPDGAIGLAIGDVVGHDLAAAAAMGHLRGLLRACAWDTAADDQGDPATVLSRVDRLVQGLHVAPLATVAYGRLEPAGESWRLRCSSAGHPRLVLRAPDGTARLLGTADDLLLGVQEGTERSAVQELLEPGTTLVAYTDGLVERRGSDLDDGVAWLLGEVGGAPVDADPEALCARLTRDLAGAEDDVALLVLRLGDPAAVRAVAPAR